MRWRPVSCNVTKLLLCISAVSLFWEPGWAENAAVYQGYVERIIDADTFRVSVLIWPTIIVQTNVRIRGIDAPESIRPGCASEKELAEKAKAIVQTLLGASKGKILLYAVSSADKYGRISAVVVTRLGINIGDELLRNGLAKLYTGKGKRPDWCREEKREEDKVFGTVRGSDERAGTPGEAKES